MDLIPAVGLAVAAAFIAVMLRRHNQEYALAVSISAGIVILALVLTQIAPVVSQLQKMLESASIPAEYGSALFKALGICLLTQLAVDTCRDAGESAMGEKASLAGKAALLIIALPLFGEIAEIAVQLISGAGINA